MSYALENENEFARLEAQSQTSMYDFKKELTDFSPATGGLLLDAGCGSGIVTRYLSERFPTSKVIGCDASAERVRQAEEAAASYKNITFSVENITSLTFPDHFFDGIICRFVLEHLSAENQVRALAELTRCLRPGGKICIVDIDGYFYNLFPQPQIVAETLDALEKSGVVDLKIGRKIPALLNNTSCIDIAWRIEMMEFHGEALAIETQLITERFVQTLPFFSDLLRSKEKAVQFQTEFLKQLKTPGSVLFYNKFIVSAVKGSPLRLIRP